MTIEDTRTELIGTEFTGAEVPHAVYRLYDAERTLLYVGVTLNLSKRMTWHASQQSWWPQVAYRTMVWYGNEWDGRKAEAEAIDAEGPLYNDLKPAVGHHAPPHGQRKGWHRNMAISWHSDDPTLKPWLKAEAKRRGITLAALLDEIVGAYFGKLDHARQVEARTTNQQIRATLREARTPLTTETTQTPGATS